MTVMTACRRSMIHLAMAATLAVPVVVLAQDSGTGIDFQFGNKLDPRGNPGADDCDPRGESWLGNQRHRTPSGTLYVCAPERITRGESWLRSGSVQLGWLFTGGDTTNANWLRYSGWDDGPMLGFRVDLHRPADGSYLEARGARVNSDNQYLKVTAGRAGAYRVDAFARTQPNVLSGTAQSIWNGVGTPHLTLVDGLTPAGSTPAQVAAASAAAPERILQVTRDKQGLGLNYFFNRQWTAYANVTNEERKGARPFGGPFFFNFPFPDNGGIYEIPRPIEDATINLTGGMRYAGQQWRMDLNYSGSFYRSRHTGYDYEVPYALYPVVPGALSARLTHGEFASEPDNDYHNVRANLTRRIAMNGELSFGASAGRMSQDDDLLAPMNCQGFFGIDLTPTGSPVNPFLFDCNDWNTPAALSRRTADMSIDLTEANAGLVLMPWTSTTLRATAKVRREDYRNTYLAFNPLTGQYGYVAENGSQGSVVPGEMGVFDPVNASNILTRVRSLALDKQTTDINVGADWRLGRKDTFGATYTYTGVERTNRERDHVDTHAVKLTWANRALDWLTFRANYSFQHQSGDAYNYDPYHHTFSSSLPGYTGDPATEWPHTVDALRKYDVASRDQHKLTLIGTLIPRHDMTLNATVRGDWNDYDAVLGRQGYDTVGASLSWDWQASPQTNTSVYAAWDRSRLGLANINEIAIAPNDPRLGGPVYDESGLWWVDDTQDNRNVGAVFNHDFGRVRLDAGWNWMHSRGITDYRFASAAALAYPVLADLGPGAYPAMTYRVNSLNVGLGIPLHQRALLRVFANYERGRIADWHYDGLENGLVVDHRVYLDSGPRDYASHLVGLMLEVAL